MNNNFLNFTYGIPTSTKSSHWDRSKKLMMKKSDGRDQTKDQASRTKNKQTIIAPVTSTATKITINSPTKSANKTQFGRMNKLVRSNSGMYLSSTKPPTSPLSPTRRKLANPPSILKKQMSIDSLNIQTANLNLNQQTKSPTSSKQASSSNLLQPVDQKKRKPISAPASTGRSNPELNR